MNRYYSTDTIKRPELKVPGGEEYALTLDRQTGEVLKRYMLNGRIRHDKLMRSRARLMARIRNRNARIDAYEVESKPESKVNYGKQCRAFADNSVERCALCDGHPGEHKFPVTAERDNERVSRLAAFALLKTVQDERDAARKRATSAEVERDRIAAVLAMKETFYWTLLTVVVASKLMAVLWRKR